MSVSVSAAPWSQALRVLGFASLVTPLGHCCMQQTMSTWRQPCPAVSPLQGQVCVQVNLSTRTVAFYCLPERGLNLKKWFSSPSVTGAAVCAITACMLSVQCQHLMINCVYVCVILQAPYLAHGC